MGRPFSGRVYRCSTLLACFGMGLAENLVRENPGLGFQDRGSQINNRFQRLTFSGPKVRLTILRH